MYKLSNPPFDMPEAKPYILRLSDGAWIPQELQNSDYQRYLEWIAEGNTPLPPDQPAQEQIQKNALAIAEQFINGQFSTTQLLQMKTWWDAIPHNATPKLSAVYQWIEDVTKKAITTTTSYELSSIKENSTPFTFIDLSQEIKTVLYPNTVTNLLSSI
jgi:hypothetical protein